MKSTHHRRVVYAVLASLLVCSSVGSAAPTANSITVVSSHPAGSSKAELMAEGGLSLYVKVNGSVILFDSGDTSSPLLERLEELGLDPALIDAVVFSHSQSDRAEGELSDLPSAASSETKIYVPPPAGEATSQRNPGATVIAVAKPTRVGPDAWLVGPIQLDTEGETTEELALVLDRPEGLVVIVGCSHPGIAEVVQQVKEVFGYQRIKLVAGGFHLQSTSKKEIREISLGLQQKGVQELALSACTGEPALKIFRREWGDRVVSLDRGDTILFDQ
jgi:7,8-dihydropterin-6-yl-methyl-4-(beta-D-ribofuranosyl)aminobenzene 5'-phosphate synthase